MLIYLHLLHGISIVGVMMATCDHLLNLDTGMSDSVR